MTDAYKERLRIKSYKDKVEVPSELREDVRYPQPQRYLHLHTAQPLSTDVPKCLSFVTPVSILSLSI